MSLTLDQILESLYQSDAPIHWPPSADVQLAPSQTNASSSSAPLSTLTQTTPSTLANSCASSASTETRSSRIPSKRKSNEVDVKKNLLKGKLTKKLKERIAQQALSHPPLSHAPVSSLVPQSDSAPLTLSFDFKNIGVSDALEFLEQVIMRVYKDKIQDPVLLHFTIVILKKYAIEIGTQSKAASMYDWIRALNLAMEFMNK